MILERGLVLTRLEGMTTSDLLLLLLVDLAGCADVTLREDS
jgi:hypothetical protein